MKTTPQPTRLIALLLAASMASSAAFAAPPPWAGGGKNGGDDRAEQKQERKGGKDRDDRKDKRVRGDDGGKGRNVARKPEPKPGAYFDDRNREAVAQYYAKPRKSCPPGLAKKNNGCMPPGQAKKWQVGQPLPAGVTYYPVPQPILVQLPPVPVGHRYVQVAGDILLIAVGSKMVVDGINGLMNR